MKHIRFSWLISGIMALLLAGPFAFISFAHAAPEALCVPFNPGDAGIPHPTYSGASITLKGIARGDATEFRWDFGDGGGTSWAAIADAYNLGASHTYTGAIGQEFLAFLWVKNGAGEESSDVYPIRIYESTDLSISSHLDVRVNMSVDEGLWYLHTHMVRSTYGAGSPGYGEPYGYWDPSYYPLAATGASVDAFQLNGHRVGGDYDSNPYVETVQRGIKYILANVYAYNIGVQPAGDPDTNGNGIGLVANHASSVTDSRQTYIGGICMITLASSGTPNRVAAVGRSDVYGRTYKEIVQDMVDFFAWGQCDPSTGIHRGGWRYYANYGNSDMSTTQWPALGTLAAEENMGSVVPGFVRTELALYLAAMQNTSLNNDNGAFSYNGSTHYYNLTKQGAGIISHEFLGTPLTDPALQKAVGYIYRHWGDTGNAWDDTKLNGNSYAMYAVMKAFRIPEPDIMQVEEYDYTGDVLTGNSFNWYYTPSGQTQMGLATYIVGDQQSDGSWDDSVGSNKVYDAFCTGWRILTLGAVTKMSPTAQICYCAKHETIGHELGQDILLDGGCSFHMDPKRHIVGYEWDFDYDGVTFVADATGMTTAIAGGYSIEGVYPVALRVTDDTAGEAQTDITECNLWVHVPPHCPYADASGPYAGLPNQNVTLDASGSWDPNNDNLIFDWDLDNDGLFGAEDDDCFGELSDAVGMNPTWIWTASYQNVIGLRVTDEPQAPFSPCTDYDYTTVTIGNQPPECGICGGPTIGANPYETITLDGSCSSDPGDTIEYAWDLNDDGNFDDCNGMECDFQAGAAGEEFDIGLRVTDSYGAYAICYAKVVTYLQDVCGGAQVGAGSIYDKVGFNLDSVNITNLGGCIGLASAAEDLASKTVRVEIGKVGEIASFSVDIPGSEFRYMSAGYYLYYDSGSGGGEIVRIKFWPDREFFTIYFSRMELNLPLDPQADTLDIQVKVKFEMTDPLLPWYWCVIAQDTWRAFPYGDNVKYRMP